MTKSGTLRVAVLINTYNGPTIPSMKQSFVDAIRTACPGAQVKFYDPIDAQIYPNRAAYDLIVLSGGTENMTGPVDTHMAWVIGMQKFLRETVEMYPKKKIMGICWGHQIICVAFGGVVESMERSELGVTTVPLSSKGQTFFDFPSNELHIHEFHKRKVITPAPGFIPLAEHNQVFVNATNTIISFQGHPELNPEVAKLMLKGAESYMCVDGQEKEAVAKTMESEHDGKNIWKRIVEWVRE